ncbi:macrolide ABC transporter permease [Arenivirga flava]|uniref:Macrolide ABC transporter permease n=2 Tax=Arenivirga flava TaxID=1930060 RepID=A0AA37X9T8_9MICO|nr:macrolide ABC transporter permease [Arenivirga flava]
MRRLREGCTVMVATLLEGWTELKVQRTRVLMSLIGIALAVCALTLAVAAGSFAEQALREREEAGSGRPATLTVSVWSETEATDPGLLRERLDPLLERYGIDYATQRGWGGTSLAVASDAGLLNLDAGIVDPPYGAMFRVPMAQGRWLIASDERMLAPAVVVDEIAWENLGSPPLEGMPTITIEGERPTTALIVGVAASEDSSRPWSPGSIHLLSDDYLQLVPDASDPMSNGMETVLWVPEGEAESLRTALQADLQAQYPLNQTIEVQRSDPAAWGGGSAMGLLWVRLGVGGVAGLVLLLAAMGLVNITMVTVKYRVREIGIRRAFGATARRVFVGVLMESVVATAFAGVIGIAVAILAVQNPWVRGLIGDGVVELPGFPFEAALVGLLVATGIGAVAGILPALVAVRVRVIDAIRF